LKVEKVEDDENMAMEMERVGDSSATYSPDRAWNR
jgi:hypothetical protein